MTGIQNYDAHEAQIRELCGRITRTSYPEMKRRAEAIKKLRCSASWNDVKEPYRIDALSQATSI